jgi:peptidoglycan/LPS O-acetylase OafA/YrhL
VRCAIGTGTEASYGIVRGLTETLEEERATMSVGHLERTAVRIAQIDALRVLSCFSVVVVHAVGGPYPPDSVGIGVTNFLLHYSREIFFFVSALVLVRTYYPRVGADGRLPDETGFRLRRLRLVGVPYLWWTTIYYAVSIFHDREAEPFGQVLNDIPLRWVYLVVTGKGDYHMYFMLVTLEYAVLFPLVLRLLRRTEGWHLLVLGGSLLLQSATLYYYQWVYLPDDGWRGTVGDASLLAYQFWLVLGAIVGLHVQRCHRWMVAHWRWVLGFLPVAAGILLWIYYAQLPDRGALGASSPLQPVMILWSLAVLGVLYLASVWIMEHGSARVRSTFSYLAQLSFGIYLAHPMVLDVVLAVLRHLGLMAPTVWVSLVSLVLTTSVTVAVCAALHRTRLSMSLMGRRRLDPASPFPLSRSARPRLLTVPAMVLTASALAVLFIGSDQSSPEESGTPTSVEIVEASNQIPRPSDTSNDQFSCGAQQSAPHSCPLGGAAEPSDDPGTSG